MDRNAQLELESIKNDLQSVINELQNISYGVKRDFDGIGNEKCSASIQRAANHYAGVKKRLNRIDTTIVTEEFKAKQEAAQTMSSSTGGTSQTSTESQETEVKTGADVQTEKDDNLFDNIREAFSWLFR